MAFGKKNVISSNLNDYSVCIVGESGIGKTTLLSKVCEKEFGDEGYLLLNCGREDGVACIDGVVYEDVDTFKKFDTVVTDIVENKDADYPDLKVVIVDTLDQLLSITEDEAIRLWNVENSSTKDFKLAKTLNATWGGFGKPEDKVCELILDRVWDLKSVGVQVWYTAHTKTRDIVDPLTSSTYTTLGANMLQRYFTTFKTKVHIVGMACVDRTIEAVGTGRKNIVTRKEVTVNRVKDERRKIVFRDDNYSVDSKSRFAGIVDEIPLDADEFIKAMKDAIAGSKKGSATKIAKPTPKMPEPEEEEDGVPFSEEPEVLDNEEGFDIAQALNDIRSAFKVADKETKTEVKEVLADYGYTKMDETLPVECANKVMEILEIL